MLVAGVWRIGWQAMLLAMAISISLPAIAEVAFLYLHGVIGLARWRALHNRLPERRKDALEQVAQMILRLEDALAQTPDDQEILDEYKQAKELFQKLWDEPTAQEREAELAERLRAQREKEEAEIELAGDQAARRFIIQGEKATLGQIEEALERERAATAAAMHVLHPETDPDLQVETPHENTA